MYKSATLKARGTSTVSSYDTMLKEDTFYAEKFSMSYSSLNLLMYSPLLFYNRYVMKTKYNDSFKYLDEGKAIHCLLLTPEHFDSEFVVIPQAVPTASILQVLNIIHDVYRAAVANNADSTNEPVTIRTKLTEYVPEIIEALKLVNLYQHLTDDDKRVQKVLTDKNIAYFEYLLNSGKKIIISSDQEEFAKEVVDKIKNDMQVMNLMGYFHDPLDDINVLNEIMLAHDDPRYKYFTFKGFIDNLVIDHTRKKISINDLKTTSKTINNFLESINFYNYDLQAAMYMLLIEGLKRSNPVIKDYDVTFRFIVVDNIQQVGAFEITKETMQTWRDKLEQMLQNVEYHFEHKDFSLPHTFKGTKVMYL